ncbi:MAG: PQQ-binding-like beta-propeller repeat protein [Anaerolineales bacterium]
MRKFSMLAIFVVFLGLLAGCATAAPSTQLATATLIPPTNTPVPPTATLPPTAIPTTEVPLILWDKTYHKTSKDDMGEDVLAADDGGFYIVGTAGLDMSGAGLSGDIYLIRTDANGEVLWEKTYGGDKSEEGLSVTRTSDGNLLLAGMTKSSGAGGADAYLVKVDLDGNEIWAKTFGGLFDESASVRELADGGFMLWGNSVNPEDVIADPGAAGYGGYEGRSNIYLAKIDTTGNQLWSHTFGDKNNLLTSGGIESPDGGFVVLASLLRFPEPGDDIYLLKLDKDGNKVWDRTWEEGTTSAYDLIRTTDDNYLIAASYASADDTARSKADFLFIKVDQQGNEIWTSAFGDPVMMDYPMSVTQAADGGYIAAGDWIKDMSGASLGLISITKIDSDGKLVWEKTIKPAGQHNVLRTWLQLADGSCLLIGSRLTQRFEIYLMKVDIGASSNAYLGQTPPGLTPQVFAPEIISIPSAMDFGGTFSPDGTEFYFTRRIDGQENVIYETHLLNGIWTEPAPVVFASGYVAFEPHVTADNQTIYFGWAHSLSSEEKSTLEAGGIWASDRSTDGWAAPRYVGEGMFVSSDQSGQVYVTDMNTRSLSKAILTDGRFTKLEYISSGIHPAIAPDGSYLVYDNGEGNLRVKFHLEDDTWSGAKNLTEQGIPASAAIASISPDGKYLFYTDNGDLYWVSTEIIKSLK